MKKLLFLVFFVTALFGAAVSAAGPVNFAGTWEFDKAKSQNPPRPWQDAESVMLTITQTDKELTIETKVTGGNPPAGPGGGRGFGGMMGPSTFNLDGTEKTTESERGKSTTKAVWSKDGKTFELTTTRIFTTPNGEITSTTTEKLSLSEDGKVLTNARHSESPRGAQDSTLVFNKKG